MFMFSFYYNNRINRGLLTGLYTLLYYIYYTYIVRYYIIYNRKTSSISFFDRDFVGTF